VEALDEGRDGRLAEACLLGVRRLEPTRTRSLERAPHVGLAGPCAIDVANSAGL
jgi:hypothetical protein